MLYRHSVRIEHKKIIKTDYCALRAIFGPRCLTTQLCSLSGNEIVNTNRMKRGCLPYKHIGMI